MLLVLPADHVLADVASLSRAVATAMPAAREGRLVTFGVVPTHAETGYGYIRQGAGQGAVRPVAEFVEKPDASARQGLSRERRVPLEQRHVPAAGPRLTWMSSGRLDPAMLTACRTGLRVGRERPGFRAARQSRLRGLPRPIRSTTR